MSFTYTLKQLTDDCVQRLRGTTRDQIRLLSSSVDAPAALTQQTLAFIGDLGGIAPDSLLILGDETMYVLSTSIANNTALVLRGYDNTTPAAAPANTALLVDPPWTRAIIQQRVRDEIRSWAPQIYRVAKVDIPIVNYQRAYDLTSVGTNTIIRVLRVTTPQPQLANSYPYPVSASNNQAQTTLPYDLDLNADTSVFPSGMSITLTCALPTTGNLHIVYATSFDVDTSWAETTDMIATVGLDESMLDIPTLGVTARLLGDSTVRRSLTNVMGASRDEQAVTMQTVLAAKADFDRQSASRLNDVAVGLMNSWPYRNSNY